MGRLVQAGLVVVVSAGNRGNTETGQTRLGSITSPGNSSFALTAGATNTWGTVDRSDDTVTTYSSRGPTPYDFGLKPDVVAPGNKIVSLEVPNGYLARTYPSGDVAGSGTNAYYRMSGTSMSAGMVSGGVALLLDAKPDLMPVQVKLALQMTASFMVEDGLMGGGAGSVNLWNARRLVGSPIISLLSTQVISGLLAAASGSVFDFYQWLVLHTTLGSSGANQLIWGDVAQWTGGNQLIWGDQIFDPEGQQLIWGDQVFDSSGQQLIWGDQTSEGYQLIWGDSYRPVEDGQ